MAPSLVICEPGGVPSQKSLTSVLLVQARAQHDAVPHDALVTLHASSEHQSNLPTFARLCSMVAHRFPIDAGGRSPMAITRELPYCCIRVKILPFEALRETVWVWQEPERILRRSSVQASPKERGPTESLPGRNAETDRAGEGIPEGCRPAGTGRVAPRDGRAPDACHTQERIGQARDLKFTPASPSRHTVVTDDGEDTSQKGG